MKLRSMLLVVCITWLAMTDVVAWAQTLEKRWEVAIPLTVSVSLDRYNRIFVGGSQGSVTQYDTSGRLLLSYSPPKTARLSVIEAWKTNKIFTFSRDFQQYTLLDRFLVPIGQYVLSPDVVGFARIAALATDDNLWVFDETEFSLKKYDWRLQSVIINAPMNLVLDTRDYDLTFMREYQNQLFISDRNAGILVFDNLGNYRKKIAVKGVASFGVLNDELYFLQDNRVHFFHLYTFQERTMDLPANRGIRQVLAFEDRLVLFYEGSMAMYQQRK